MGQERMLADTCLAKLAKRCDMTALLTRRPDLTGTQAARRTVNDTPKSSRTWVAQGRSATAR